MPAYGIEEEIMNERTRKDLLAAAELIEQHGWVRGKEGSCATGFLCHRSHQ